MIAARRVPRMRYEVRVGTREVVVLGLASCLIAGVIFTAGVLVGRGAGPGPRLAAPTETAREPARPDAGGLRPEPGVKTAAHPEEKFTFYKTLTAPSVELPPVVKPRVEERMVPSEPSPPPGGDAGSPGAASVRPGRVPAARAPGSSQATRVATPPAPAHPAPVPPAPTASPPPGPEAWTVQVSAFRSRVLAEDLRTRLAARGFDAYVLTSAAEDGRTRYRVRVGAYSTRGEAERVVAVLRGERGLNPIVTSRTR